VRCSAVHDVLNRQQGERLPVATPHACEPRSDALTKCVEVTNYDTCICAARHDVQALRSLAFPGVRPLSSLGK